MKNTIISYKILILAIVFIGCTKDDDTVKTSTPVVVPVSTSLKGNFVSSAHPTSGTVTISLDKTKLNMDSFKTDSGPKLNIYLASDINNINANYKDLGEIKGLNGNYTYDILPNTDLTVYKYVVVWCVDFNVNFGYATLAP